MNRYLRIGIPIVILAATVVVLSQMPFVRRLDKSGHKTIYVVMKTTGSHMEFWQIVRAGINAAATEFDVKPRIVGPKLEKDVDKQMQILSRVIKDKPDGIILVAADYNRLVPLAKKAAAEGVPIVTLDSALNSKVPVSFVATDNVAAGRKAGMEIARLVPPDRPIAIISHIRGVATAIDREKGVRDALEKLKRDAPVGTYFAENNLERAYRIVKKLLHDYPRIGGIVALNEESTVGAARALVDFGAADRVKVVGFDNSKAEIEFLESGVVKALVVQKPFNMGYLGIRTLLRAIQGEHVPPVIHTASVLVRRNDMFTPENQKLLFPLLPEQK